MTMIKKRPRRCDIPGCPRRSQLTFLPADDNVGVGSIRICKRCNRRHNSRDPFSVWEKIPVSFVPSLRISGKKASIHAKAGVKHRGKEARCDLQRQYEQEHKDCEHPYRMVRWDKVYCVVRCLQCGRQVYRKKGIGDYKTKRKIHAVRSDKSFNNVTLEVAMMMFFFQNGIVETTWEDAIKIARAVKPGTKFNAASFSWYRTMFISRYILRKGSKMGRGDRKKRSHKKTEKVRSKKRGRAAERTTSKKKKKVEKVKKGKKKKKTIQSIVLDYFDQVGVDKAKYEKTKARVLKVHPESAFQESHMAWYRGKWHEVND